MPELVRIFDDLLLEGTKLLEQRTQTKYGFRIPEEEYKLRCLKLEMRHFILEIDNSRLQPDSQLCAILFCDNIHMSVIDTVHERYLGNVVTEYLPLAGRINKFILSTDAGMPVNQDIAQEAIKVYRQSVLAGYPTTSQDAIS